MRREDVGYVENEERRGSIYGKDAGDGRRLVGAGERM